MKHTPGPWIAEINSNGDYEIRLGSVREIYVQDSGEDDDDVKADALLISAAPEMYEALRWLLHLCSGISKGGDDCPVTQEEWNNAWDEAIKTVKKAEGLNEQIPR